MPSAPLLLILCGIFFIFHKKVDSANKHGILLDVVQVLTDLNLIIVKAYISSDGGWFMDGKFLLITLLHFYLFFWVSSAANLDQVIVRTLS